MMSEQAKEHELRHLNFQGGMPAQQRRRARLPAMECTGREAETSAVATEQAGACDPFIAWLFSRAGLDPMVYRAGALQRRLPACLRALKSASTAQAQQRLEHQPQLLTMAMDSLLLGVTEFFRDVHVFESLRTLLPGLIEQKRPLKIWSVCCSVGCELYSVGLLLQDLGLLHGSHLLGTDCREEALRCAQRGSYSESHLRRLTPLQRQCHFDRESCEYRVREPLRSQPQWRLENVLLSSNQEVWDVILWRNTAIYLKSAAARSVWHRLACSLRPGGLLVTGKAERPDCGLPFKRLAGCIHQRLPN